MRGEINVEVKVWRDKEYTGGRWREGTKVGPGVLNRFIGLKPGHHYSRLAFCRPIVPGREDCTVSICPRRPVSRANHRASFSSIPSNSLRIALRSFASFHRVNRNGSTSTTIDPRPPVATSSHENPRHLLVRELIWGRRGLDGC